MSRCGLEVCVCVAGQVGVLYACQSGEVRGQPIWEGLVARDKLWGEEILPSCAISNLLH